MNILSRLHSPDDLRKLPQSDLKGLCGELREFIVDTVADNGGHFGASLGAIELTVALHYVFKTPDDKIVFDVGHQAYAHKILTERKSVFHTNRQINGISGFPKRDESIYDAFGTGHSSTSIAAVLGMATAANLQGNTQQQHIALIGDGGLTAGLAFEALNYAGANPHLNAIILLNDNAMSIDQNTGALHQLFHLENDLDGSQKNARRFFESLQLPYFGIIDGHDIDEVIKNLRFLSTQKGVKVLHCRTVKGKGYAEAEDAPIEWHATGKFDKTTGKPIKKSVDAPQPPKYQDVFGETLSELARQNEKIVAVTPAMLSGSSLTIMQKAFPDRVFDVGIAEQYAVTFAAGLATQGFLPFCHVYSTFLQRAYDQVIHDVCLQNLSVIFCLDRAGLVGADGATHHGAFDLAFLRCLPNISIAAPMTEIELRNMLYSAQTADFLAQEHAQVLAIRYPRGAGVHAHWQLDFEAIPFGKGRCLKTGSQVAVLSIGHIGNAVSKALQNLPTVAHYDMRFIKPLDETLLHHIFQHFETIVTVEDGCKSGGFGSAVLEFMAENNYKNMIIKHLGLPDSFIEQGEPQELYAFCGLDAAGIEKFINGLILSL